MSEALAILKPEDFYYEPHTLIFHALSDLWDEGAVIDYPLLCQKLESKNQLETVGGPSYLTGLLKDVATPAHMVHYAKIVIDMATKRHLMVAGSELIQMATDTSLDTTEVLEQGQALLGELGRRVVGKVAVPFDEALKRYWEGLARESRGEVVRLPFGFRDLDRIVGGLGPGDLCYVAGRPSTGKTTMALAAMLNLAKISVGPIALFSVESAEEELAGRLLGYISGIFPDAIRKKHISQKRLDWLNVLSQEIPFDIVLEHEYALTPATIDAALSRLRPKFVVIDHIQRMSAGFRIDKRSEEMSYISRKLKELATKHKVPLVVISILSRAVEHRKSRRPTLGDLKESGDLEHDADVVVLLYWDGLYEPESAKRFVLEANVAKNRNGPTGTAFLRRAGQGQLSDMRVKTDG